MATRDICLDEEENETDRFWDNIREPRQSSRLIDGYQDIPLVSLEVAIESIVDGFPDIYEYLITAMSKCQRPADGLSQNESAAIYLYTMHWEPSEKCLYYVLNTALRKQNREDIRPWLPFLKLLLSALQKLPSYDGTLWRGVTLDLSGDYEMGELAVWQSFSSCTQSIAILKSNVFLGGCGPRTLFNIECQNGKAIRLHSHFSSEDEVLLLPGTQFEVKSKLKVAKADLDIIHLIEIGSLIPRPELPGNTPTKQPLTRRRESGARRRTEYRNDTLENLITKCPSNGIANLNGQGLSDNDISIIVDRLINKKKPTVLQMCSNQITGQGAQLLGKALQSSNAINQLIMRENQISDTGARSFAQALCINSTLTCLNLVNNQINDEGATCLARSLYLNTTLTKLYLANNAIGHDSIQRFAQALTHNRTLIMLDLSFNRITDDQIVYLAAMLQKNHTLRILGLAENAITNAGMKFLMYALRHNQGLRGLNVACPQLTYGCIRDIQNMLKHNEILMELWLSGSAFSTLGRLKFWSINRSLHRRQIRLVENRKNQTG